MNDIAAGLFLLVVVIPVILGLAIAFLTRKKAHTPKHDKKGPLVEDAGHGWVWVTRGKKRELMTIETAEAAGYIKKKDEKREQLKSAFGVPLGKG